MGGVVVPSEQELRVVDRDVEAGVIQALCCHPLRRFLKVASRIGLFRASLSISILRYYRPNAIAVINAILKNSAVLPHVHVAFAAEQHQIAIITEVIVPIDYLFVGPVRPVLLQLPIRHEIEIGPEVDCRFIEGLVVRFLFKIPDSLFHRPFVVGRTSVVSQKFA